MKGKAEEIEEVLKYVYVHVHVCGLKGYTYMYAYLVFCVICWDGGGSGNVEGGIEQTSFNLREGKWEERRQQETKRIAFKVSGTCHCEDSGQPSVLHIHVHDL